MKKIEGKHILIVDDGAVNLQIISSILSLKGYTTTTATNGNEALKFLETERTDLILLDVEMPGINGFDTCREIKNQKNFKHIPVIFLTAKTKTDDILAGFDAGGVDYITKPFQEKVLMARIRTHLELKDSREILFKQTAELQQKNMELTEAGDIIRSKNLELKKTMEKLEETVRIDHLTGLFNRRHISEIFTNEKARVKRNDGIFSIILSDVDKFKSVNDNHGHQFGDYVLKTISTIMNSSIREQDTLARWGGEEFILLLPDTPGDGAETLADKLRNKIAGYDFSDNGANTKVTMTFGISVFKKGSDIDTVIQQADQALYKGKEKGRNCTIRYKA